MKEIFLSMRGSLLSFLLLLSFFSFAQNSFPVSGKVTDPQGQPVEGVTVQESGTKNVVLTKVDGSFSINVSSGTASLQFTSIGFETQVVKLNNQAQLTIGLKGAASKMDEVVVIGYGTQKRRNVTFGVTNFDAKNLEQRPVGRVDQALVGQMAGVTVKQTTGALGKGLSVQIRGGGSISAGSEPLYVIDGFPLAGAGPNGAGNYATGNPLDNINPNDIESVQVLKDAAAAAIYGSRAGNGVVLITTKRGQSGKARISLNSYIGYMERNRKLDMLSAEEWVDRTTEIINAQWVASGTGRTASQTNEERRVILGLAPGIVNTTYMTDDRWYQPGHPGLRYFDWQEEAFRKGLQQNHQISATGGNENIRYFISGNYTRQEGMIINTDYTSFSARANVEASLSKRLKVGLNINPSYSINNDPGVEGKDNILHQLISFTPVQEDTMGILSNIGKNNSYRWSNSPNSPVAKLLYYQGQTKRFRTLASMFAEIEIIKGLTAKSSINFDNTDNNAKSYTPAFATNNLVTRQAQGTALTSGSQNNYRKQTLANENTINYNHRFGGDHDVSAMVGAGYYQDKIERVSLSSQNGFNSAVITTLNAANAVTGNSFETKNVLMSYFGRVQYDFRGKYLVSASMRRDGSSRFGENNKWASFPSLSLGWRISEESFMKGIQPISELKLRASYGTAGNYNIPDYAAATLGTYNYTFNGVAVVGTAPNVIYNPDVTWEQAKTIDVGVDVGLLRNRITVALDYYTKLNSQLLLNVPTYAITGFPTVLANAGSVRTKGWEVEITSRNVSNRDFQWTTSLNLSHNSNKVESLPGGQQQILIPSAFDISHSILRVGQPMYSIYVVKQVGILTQDDINKGAARFGSQVAGDPKYQDQLTIDTNGDGVPDKADGVIDANDRVIVGHPNPDYTWGITNTVRYKNFDLSVLVQGQNGGSIYSLLGRAINRTGQGFTDNAIGAYRNRWRSDANPGEGVIGKVYSTFGRIKNTDWLYSSNYIRIRNITLGYDLKNGIKMKHLQGVRLYVTLENFFGWDKYTGGFNPEATNTDVSGSSLFPEAGDYGGLPLPRSLVFGLNVNF